VKALFAVQRRPTTSYGFDSGATFFDTSAPGLAAGTLQQYQYRIGGRYFPAAPVQTSAIGAAVHNGACEAFLELQKSLNIVGDYRLQTNVNAKNWALPPFSILNGTFQLNNLLPEYDYQMSISDLGNTGVPLGIVTEAPLNSANENSFSGSMPSSCFAMSTNLETSNGVEISGLNAEEQSDIALIANWKNPQVLGTSLNGSQTQTTGGPSNLEVYSYFDAMIILRENNVLELIQ